MTNCGATFRHLRSKFTNQFDKKMFRLVFIFFCFHFVDSIDEKLLFQCDFDQSTPTDHCFNEDLFITSSWSFVNDDPPDRPLSDVTAICKTQNKKFKMDFFIFFLSFVQLDRRTIRSDVFCRSNGKIKVGIRFFVLKNFVQQKKTTRVFVETDNSA